MCGWYRGLISATLAEPAAGIENRHPRLVVAMQAVFHAVLRLPYIRNRLEEVLKFCWLSVSDCSSTS